ncbi:MAG: NAD(P)/FAD-dependent oxidoreductase [Lachnospiraceae bacterium]|nr:NAD(P)/FAD-dependent oxidoreductase [Lachnospiraceae bacterium]
MKRIAVIGGGAAGMIAAYAAAANGNQVTVFEKNEKLGKKLFITGKGRCNVTNAADMEECMKQVVSNPRFLYSAFYTFSNQSLIDLIEEAGCPLKTERGQRVFPQSDKSSDIIAALTRLLQQKQVNVRLRTGVKSLRTDGERVTGLVTERGETVAADAVIVATGGLSYPSTGSTGDGYRFAKSLGHEVTELRPALVPLVCREEWAKELQGLSLKNVSVRVTDGKKTLYQEFGELLFTHFGVSGPLILSASSKICRKLAEKPLSLSIDLKPALTMEQLDARLLRDFEQEKNRQFKNSLSQLYPARLADMIVRLSEIEPEKPVNSISREERARIVCLTKNLPLTITGTRDYNEAIITQGGIRVREIDPSTMESKLVPGLFFAGEVLDLDAMTGGFNLQIAWSTGYLAGISV